MGNGSCNFKINRTKSSPDEKDFVHDHCVLGSCAMCNSMCLCHKSIHRFIDFQLSRCVKAQLKDEPAYHSERFGENFVEGRSKEFGGGGVDKRIHG